MTGWRFPGRQPLLIVAIASALLLIALSYHIQRATEQQIAEHFNQQQLHLARETAIRIEDLFVAVLSSLELAGSLVDPNVPSSALSPRALRALYDALQEKGPIDAVFVLGADGRIGVHHPIAGESGRSLAQAARALAAVGHPGEPRVVVVPVRNGGMRHQVDVAVPLRRTTAGSPESVVAVLDLEALLELHISSIRSGQTGYGWLMDAQGTLLHHPHHPDMVNRNVLRPDPACRECHESFVAEQHMAAGRTGLARQRVGRDADTLFAYHPIRLGREPLALLDLAFAAGTRDADTRPALRAKARQVAEELSQIVGRAANLEHSEVLAGHLGALLRSHPGLATIRIWSKSPESPDASPTLLAAAPSPDQSPPTLPTEATIGPLVVLDPESTHSLGPRVLLPLPLGVDLWSVAVAAPYAELRSLVRASTFRIWAFSGSVLVLLLLGGGVVTWLWTARAQAEERARASEAILQMHQQMEQSRRLSALGEMVARVAHEVRNPLLSISSGVELLRGEVSEREEAAPLIANIREAIRRLDGIMGDLLNFTRPLVLDPVETDLHAVIDSALIGLRERIARGRVELIRRYAELPRITADTLRLSQLFTNLFTNALEAMPGGGRLTVVTEPASGPAEGVWVRVQDTGQGIPAESLPRIFDPFITTKKRGIGLGLAVVRRIVELHGGRIQAVNRAEGGAEFIVELPIHAPTVRSEDTRTP
jgi:signal transduction histidine kinase